MAFAFGRFNVIFVIIRSGYLSPSSWHTFSIRICDSSEDLLVVVTEEEEEEEEDINRKCLPKYFELFERFLERMKIVML